MHRLTRLGLAACVCVLIMSPAWPLASADIAKLAQGEVDEKSEAVSAIVAAGDASAIPFLQALVADTVKTTADRKVLIVKGDKGTDAVTGNPVVQLPTDLEDVIINNQMRGEIGTAIAALRLGSPSRDIRLAAAKELQGNAEAELLPLLARVLARETDAQVRELLVLTRASLELASDDRTVKLAAKIGRASWRGRV